VILIRRVERSAVPKFFGIKLHRLRRFLNGVDRAGEQRKPFS
jgi:hypothetical protein